MQHKTITFRAPVSLIQAIDELARLESARTGLPVDRSGIVRRALEVDLERRRIGAGQQKEGEKK